MISAIIFSKNRALQLDLLLNSIYKNLPQCNQIKLIWKADEEHLSSYQALTQEHKGRIYSIQQGINFYEDLYNACKHCSNNYVVMLTDDDIVYNQSNVSLETLYNLNNKEIFACYSLRLGLNTNKRQIENNWYPDFPTHFDLLDNNTVLAWNRTDMLTQSYWSYALSVDGHIFNKYLLLDILYEIFTWSNIRKYIQTPNKLEGLMQRFFFEIGPIMLCGRHSSVVNSPNNRVQDDYKNRCGDIHSYCESHLNQLYAMGKRINIADLDFSHINCPHTELDILK